MKPLPQPKEMMYISRTWRQGMAGVINEAMLYCSLRKIIDMAYEELHTLVTEFEPTGLEPLPQLVRARLAVQADDLNLAVSWFQDAVNTGWVAPIDSAYKLLGITVIPGTFCHRAEDVFEDMQDLVDGKDDLSFHEEWIDDRYIKSVSVYDLAEAETVTLSRIRYQLGEGEEMSGYWADEIVYESEWGSARFNTRELPKLVTQLFE